MKFLGYAFDFSLYFYFQIFQLTWKFNFTEVLKWSNKPLNAVFLWNENPPLYITINIYLSWPENQIYLGSSNNRKIKILQQKPLSIFFTIPHHFHHNSLYISTSVILVGKLWPFSTYCKQIFWVMTGRNVNTMRVERQWKSNMEALKSHVKTVSLSKQIVQVFWNPDRSKKTLCISISSFNIFAKDLTH